MSFATITSDGPIPVILIGAGFWGGEWLKALPDAPAVRLVGFVDAVPGLLSSRVEEFGLDVVTGTSLAEVAAATGAIAIINATPHSAHLQITLEALGLGLHVLGEKPLASSLAEAVQLETAAAASGLLFMVSQSRGYIDPLFALRDALAGHTPVSLSQRFAGHAGNPGDVGFRFTMESPLLTDMSIHHFDAARLVLGQDAVWVQCTESNPDWSWFDGAAVAHATFGMANGTVYQYEGSWVALGGQTSWNADWSVATSSGSLGWNGEDAATSVAPDGTVSTLQGTSPHGEYLVGGATAFADALRSGVEPRGIVSENIQSLAMVHAAMLSARTGERIDVQELIKTARG